MANRLKKMVFREVSGVDEPASPGSYVILMKHRNGLRYEDLLKAHDVSGEPRDDHGRWTTDAAKAAESVRHVIHSAALFAHKYGTGIATPAFRAVFGTRILGANPIAGGGVEVRVKTPVGSEHHVISHVQIRPEHLNSFKTRTDFFPADPQDSATDTGYKRAAKLLDAAHHALISYGRVIVPSRTGMISGSIEPNTPVVAAPPPGSTPPWNGATAIQTRAVPSTSLPPSTVEQMRGDQWKLHPTNGQPMNVDRGRHAPGGIPIPLNHPNINPNTSGGHAFLTEDGDFIPAVAGEPNRQIAAQNYLVYQTRANSRSPAEATPDTSSGNAYTMPGTSDVVPSGSPVFQAGIEAQYLTAGDRIKALTSAKMAHEDRLRSNAAATAYVSKSLFAPTPQLFSASPQLFTKNSTVNEARDAFGRWWTSGGADAAVRAGKAVARSAKSLVRQAPKIATSIVTGAAGIPDTEAMHLGQHVQNAVEYAASHPRVAAAGKKLVGTARLFFRKAQNDTLFPPITSGRSLQKSRRIVRRAPLQGALRFS